MRMIRAFAACAVLALALSACSTTGRTHASIGQQICSHADVERTALDVAMTQTVHITDPVAQEAARAAIRISYAALDRCPNTGN